MKGIMIIAAAVLFVTSSFGIAYAHCGMCGGHNSKATGIVVAAAGEKASGADSAEETGVVNDIELEKQEFPESGEPKGSHEGHIH